MQLLRSMLWNIRYGLTGCALAMAVTAAWAGEDGIMLAEEVDFDALFGSEPDAGAEEDAEDAASGPDVIALEPVPPADAPPASPRSGARLEEIVVTARRREERSIDVPETIQAFSGRNLEDAGVQSVKDLPRLTPNFQLIESLQPGSIMINIRGIGQLRNGEAPIAYVVDGVQATIANQITQTLFDVERIEVLKGPQGAVYGRNAIGGAVSVTTKQPTDVFEGRITGSAGNGDSYNVSAQLSGPVVEDKVAFRVAGRFRDFRGLIRGEHIQPDPTYVDDERMVSGRFNLLLDPTDRFGISLIASYDDIEAGAAYYTPYSTLRALGRSPDRDISEPRPVVMDRKGLGLRTMKDFTVKADYEFSAGTLTSISAYGHLDSYLDEDLDWTRLPLLTAEQFVENEVFSQELRFVSDSGGRFRYLGGVYYLQQELARDSIVYLGDIGNIDLGVLNPIIDELLGWLVPLRFDEKSTRDDNESYAVFGHVEFDVTPNLTGALGLRYDVDRREQFDPVEEEFSKATFRSLQPKVNLSYNLAHRLGLTSFDALNLYLSVGKGFRSGGFNPTDQVGRKYGKEELINYEVGVKSRLFGRVDFNTAAFYMDIRDRQVYTLDLLTVSQLIANPIEKAHVFGVEVELSSALTERLFAGIGFGYLRTRIDKYDPSVYQGTVARGDFTGNHLNQTPEFSYNATLEYTQPLGALQLVGRADVYGSAGDYFWEINNADIRDSQVFANFSLTLRSDRWSVGAFVENAFDERYVVEFAPYEFTGGLSDLGMPSRPRQYGMRLGMDF